MELLIDRKELSEKLTIASLFLGKGNDTLGITKGILLFADEDREAFFIYASNFHRACKIKIENEEKINFKSFGKVVTDGKKFIKLIKSLTGEKIKIKATKKMLMISSITGKKINQFRMAIYQDGVEKFASIKTPTKNAVKKEIKLESFLNIIDKIKFAADISSAYGEEAKQCAETIFFSNDIIFATNKQKIAAVINSENDNDFPNITLNFPKNYSTFLKSLSEIFTIYIEGDIFYIEDNDLFFMFQGKYVKSPEKTIKKILKNKQGESVIYDLEEEEIKELITTFNQMKILNEYMTFYLTENAIWICGVDLDDSASNSSHTSIKALKINPKKIKKNILITFKVDYFKKALEGISKATILFEGGYEEHGFARIYCENYQAVIPPIVPKVEKIIFKRIKEFQENA